ncbi:MAG: PAS domain-containing protein [Vicinamibacterales bacterium]
MAESPLLDEERRRLEALTRYDVLDTDPEQALDDLTALAALVCEAPISLITLVDEDRQWFKSRQGIDLSETPRDVSFCTHAIREIGVFAVEDATADARFADNPFVTGAFGVRFYAGAPLRTQDGYALGTLCVIDRVPRRLTESQVRALELLSRQVMMQLEARRQHRALADSEERLFAVFKSCPVGVAVHRSSDRTFVDCNDAFADLLGHPRDAIVGATADELRLDMSTIADIRARFGGRDSASNVPVSLTTANGEERHLVAGLVRVRLRGEPHTVITAVDLTDQRRAEGALVASESRLRLALESARMGTFDWDIASGELTWSRRHEELFGYEPGKGSYRYEDFAARVHPDDVAAVDDEVALCMRERRPFERAYRVVLPDATERQLTGRGTFDYDDDGRPLRMRGVVVDTTARWRAEQHAERLTRAYAVLSDINQTIVREHDIETMLRAACRIAVDKGGFRMAWIGLVDQSSGALAIRAHAGADDATVAILHKLIDLDPPAGCIYTWQALRRGHHGVSEDIAVDPQAASWRDIALAREYRTMAAFPLVVDGEVLGVFNVYGAEPHWFDAEELRLFDELASDLSYALEQHKRGREHLVSEEQRHAAEERFRQLAENIQQVFWMVDPVTGEVLYVSPAYEVIWGRSSDSLYKSSRDWFEAIHPDDRQRVATALRTRWPGGHYDEVYRIVRPDGSVRWIRDRAYPIEEGGDDHRRIAGTATDITEQRQLEDQLRQSQKMESIGRLAGGIAHDFNNLLTVINGVADLAVLGLQAQDPLRSDLEQIRQAGERAATLTRQLLALSRQQILRPKVINLSTVVANTERMLRRLIGEDITMEFALGEVGRVRADPGQMEQVLLNLVVNARDAMPSGGTLAVEVAGVELGTRQAAGSP